MTALTPDEIKIGLLAFANKVVDEQKKDFIEYVKRYSKEHRMTPFDSCSHALVKEYGYELGLSDSDILEIRKDL